jgi:5-methylcytosine-specific restriction enzyme A
MQASDDDGTVLDAEFHIEVEGPHLALVMESSGGKVASGTRNPAYNDAMDVLLSRLANLGAVLVDALVDSRETKRLGLLDEERRIIDSPIRLKEQADLKALRRQMGTAQSKIGQAPDATKPGNATKRIRLRVDVPGYGLNDAASLEAMIATAHPKRTFILTWNPDRWAWPTDVYAQAVQATVAGKTWPDSWSVGLRRQGITAGDRAYLLRQNRDRGVVASGFFTSDLELSEHWDGSGRLTTSAALEWDTVLETGDRLLVEQLKTDIPEVRWDRIQGSGVAVPPASVQKLDQLWKEHAGTRLFHSPDDLHVHDIGQTFPEGAVTSVPVNRYERDPRARKACLDYWGYRCAVCNFSFADRYGQLGQEFIHVHHVIELSRVPANYHVNPIRDLRPLCPNCHAMIHRTRPAMSVDDLKAILLPLTHKRPLV